MPKGSREVFKVEIVLDFDQKKILKKVAITTSNLRKLVMSELMRQYNTISLFQSSEEITRALLEDAIGEGLLESTVRHAVRETHEQFLLMTKTAGGKEIRLRLRKTPSILFEVPKDDILFSISEKSVRVPYLGIVRYKPNPFFSIDYSRDTPLPEGMKTAQTLVKHVYLGTAAAITFLQFDCRDEKQSDLFTRPAIQRRRRQLSELLK